VRADREEQGDAATPHTEKCFASGCIPVLPLHCNDITVEV
jgi:hypothetical protein